MIKKTTYLVLLLALVACSGTSRDRRSNTADEPTPIPTAVVPAKPIFTVERGTVIYQLEFSGRVAPVVEQVLSFAIDGTIAQTHVQRDQSVEAGDLIAELDTSTLDAELLLAQSTFAIAQSQLDAVQAEQTTARRRAEIQRDLAQLDLDHAVEQAGESPTPEQQYQIDRLTLQLELAQLDLDELDITANPALEAAVQQAALKAAELENAIAHAVLVAPFDGQITALSAAPGRTVSAGDLIGVIADTSQIEISANLRDNQLQMLSEDMAASIALPSPPGEPLTGFVRQLPYPYGSGGDTGAADADTSVRISFDHPEQALGLYELGERVNLQVVITERPDALWLPPAAIREFSGRHFVVVQIGETQQRVDVTLGITGDGRVEIVDGLTEGQTIIGQ